jgi:hypothetical protein
MRMNLGAPGLYRLSYRGSFVESSNLARLVFNRKATLKAVSANQKLRLGKFGNGKSERRSRQGTSTPPVKRAHGSQIFGSFSRITHARQIFGEFSIALLGRAVSPMFSRGFLQCRRGCPAAPHVPASLSFSAPRHASDLRKPPQSEERIGPVKAVRTIATELNSPRIQVR